MGYYGETDNYNLEPIATEPYRRMICTPDGYFLTYANFPADKYWEYERTVFLVTDEDTDSIQDISPAFENAEDVDLDLFESWHVGHHHYLSYGLIAYEIRSNEML